MVAYGNNSYMGLFDKGDFLTVQGSVIWTWVIRIFLLCLILFVFFLSIDLMIQAQAFMGKGTAKVLIQAAEVPFIALFIGLLSTALIQSSSTVTAMTVAIVASGTISLSSGVFIMMGANIGTTLTSDIISLGFIINRSEFRKAVSAGVVHDFFNILTTIIIFPLEYYYQLLSKSALYLTGLISSDQEAMQMQVNHFNIPFLNPITEKITLWIGNNWLTLIISIVLLFISIKLFSGFSYKLLIGESRDRFKHFIFSNPLKSFTWGIIFTSAMQSSSITTSVVVPLVATRKVLLKDVFPFIMGANIGTTVTALLAALFKSEAAISLAIAHLAFNLLGVTIFLPLRLLRSIPVFIAKWFGNIASQQRIVGFFYILLTFFIIPFILIYLSQR